MNRDQTTLKERFKQSLPDEVVDRHLDNILKASGSALRHYTMQKSKDEMREALREATAAIILEMPGEGLV